MKRALSFILGLLVLFTAFSNGATAAPDTYFEHFDQDITLTRVNAPSFTYYYYYEFGDIITAEVFEVMFTELTKVSEGWQGVFLTGTDGYKYIIRFVPHCIYFDRYTSTLSFDTPYLFSVSYPAIMQNILIRLEWVDDKYVFKMFHVEQGGLTLLFEANTTLTTKLAVVEWGIAGDIEGKDVSYSISNSTLIVDVTNGGWHAEIDYIKVGLNVAKVTFDLKDGLTGQSIAGVMVKENGAVLGTVDDGGSLYLQKGIHTLTFEKSGYWSVTKTIDVQDDMSVSVEMYPNTAAVKFTNVPENLTFYAGTINTVSFTIEPIQESAAKNAYISFSGITPLNVRINGQVVTPENNKYYVGDVQGPVSVSVDFEVSEAIGTKSFSATVLSYDLLGNSYTATKTITYDVQALPFIIEWPTWQIGDNTLRIVEQSGDSYLVSVSLLDANGTEVYFDSYVFGPYESHDFVISLDKAEGYTLRITWNNNVLERTISATYPIELLTKSITAGEGDIATVSLKIRNVADVTYYYNITLDGPIFSTPVTKSVSVAPNSEKTVYIDFRVPENLEFDAYTLNVQVETNGQAVFTDTVTLTIDNTGFSLGLGSLDLGGLGDYWVYIIGALVVLGILLFLKR